MDAQEILHVRHRLRLNQSRFAELLAVSVPTLQAWERGEDSPGPPAAALLTLAARAKLEAHTE